jgi:hypothetical protein
MYLIKRKKTLIMPFKPWFVLKHVFVFFLIVSVVALVATGVAGVGGGGVSAGVVKIFLQISQKNH